VVDSPARQLFLRHRRPDLYEDGLINRTPFASREQMKNIK